MGIVVLICSLRRSLQRYLTGVLDDCFCDIESIDVFNNFKIYPHIRKLTERDFFRYYKVNLKRPCPFWPDDGHCSIKDCHVEPCPEVRVQHVRLICFNLTIQKSSFSFFFMHAA
uniref:Uncharacterized protein n=1 Tax=Cyprinus carpio TaxID=7962 RepID=A0A8C2GMG0_CYPCA